MSREPKLVTLACILRPQGRRGEVLAELLTDFPDQFKSDTLLLVSTTCNSTALIVEQYWMPTGRNAGRVVLKIAGVDSISDAEKLAGFEVKLPAEARLALDSDTYYVDDLVGCSVRDGDVVIGEVTDLQFSVTSDGRRLSDSAPLFTVRRSDGHEILIPFANDFVETINLEARLIVMALPMGLIELNG